MVGNLAVDTHQSLNLFSLFDSGKLNDLGLRLRLHLACVPADGGDGEEQSAAQP